MLITKIAVIKDNECGIWIDGVQRATVDAEVIYAEGLGPGLEIDAEYLAFLEQKANLVAAKSKALHLLGARDYAYGELVRRLTRHYDEKTAEAAVYRMAELGLVDDRKYAEKYARELLERRGLSLQRAAFEMRQRGLENAVIEEALAGYEDGESGRIAALLQTKYADRLSTAPGRKNVTGALVRLGFAYDDVCAAMAEYADAADNANTDE